MEIAKTDKLFPCACCGFLTRSEEEFGTFEVCDICGWEDDDLQSSCPTFAGGANEMSLIEARESYLKIGAVSDFETEWGKGEVLDIDGTKIEVRPGSREGITTIEVFEDKKIKEKHRIHEAQNADTETEDSVDNKNDSKPEN